MVGAKGGRALGLSTRRTETFKPAGRSQHKDRNLLLSSMFPVPAGQRASPRVMGTMPMRVPPQSTMLLAPTGETISMATQKCAACTQPSPEPMSSTCPHSSPGTTHHDYKGQSWRDTKQGQATWEQAGGGNSMTCPRLLRQARVTNAPGRGCCSPDTIHAANPTGLSVTSAPAAGVSTILPGSLSSHGDHAASGSHWALLPA